MENTTSKDKFETHMLLRRIVSAPAILYSDNHEQHQKQDSEILNTDSNDQREQQNNDNREKKTEEDSEDRSMLYSGKDQTRLHKQVKPFMLHQRSLSAPAVLFTTDSDTWTYGQQLWHHSGATSQTTVQQIIPCEILNTDFDQQEQNNGEKKIQEDIEVLYAEPDQQEQQNNNGEKKFQQDSEDRSMLYSGKDQTRLLKQVKPFMLHQRSLSAPAVLFTTDSDSWTYGQQPWHQSGATSQTTAQQIIPCEVLKGRANLVVAKDGTGKYKTVNDAVRAAPNNSTTQFIIYVKTGVYNEIVRIPSTKPNITILGDGSDKTILTGSRNHADGVKTFDSATLAVDGDRFIGRCICIRNTAGPLKDMAVALRVSGKASALYLCSIEGNQDTLYAHQHQQFYRECSIIGSIDFICGDASAVFQKCQIKATRPKPDGSNVITAQKCETPKKLSGFSFQNCTITATPDLTPFKGKVKTYLGRPWGDFSRVVFMNCFLDDLIDSAGWLSWNNKPQRVSTVYYGEYKNRGPGAGTSGRPKWKGLKVITDTKEAEKFTVRELLFPDLWLKSTGIPYDEGLI